MISGQSIRDQTTSGAENSVENEPVDESSKPAEDPNVIFAEEYPGKWRGYIEWENYPENKAKAVEILALHKFPPLPEFQSVSLMQDIQ